MTCTVFQPRMKTSVEDEVSRCREFIGYEHEVLPIEGFLG